MTKAAQREALRRYCRGLQLANQLELLERRGSSPVERMSQICLWFNAAFSLGVNTIALAKRTQAEEEAFYKVWGALQKAGRAAGLARRNPRAA